MMEQADYVLDSPKHTTEQDTKERWLYTFAGQAMGGLISGFKSEIGSTPNRERTANRAVEFAQALLAELEKRKNYARIPKDVTCKHCLSRLNR